MVFLFCSSNKRGDFDFATELFMFLSMFETDLYLRVCDGAHVIELSNAFMQCFCEVLNSGAQVGRILKLGHLFTSWSCILWDIRCCGSCIKKYFFMFNFTISLNIVMLPKLT